MSSCRIVEGSHNRFIIRPPFLIKDVEANNLESLPFEEAQEQAATIARRLERYYLLLKKAGLPVPPHHEVKIRIDATGVHVFETMDLGCNLEISPTLVQQMITESAGVLLDPTLGLDAQPDNYVGMDQGGRKGGKMRLCFCDLHPARYLEKDGKTEVFLVGFPQPVASEEVELGRIRYYDPVGILRRLRFHLARRTGEDWSKLIVSTARSISLEVANRVSAVFQAMDGDLSTMDVSNLSVDDCRDLAVRLLSQERPGLCQKVFDLTHIDFRLTPEERGKKIEDAKRLLQESLK